MHFDLLMFGVSMYVCMSHKPCVLKATKYQRDMAPKVDSQLRTQKYTVDRPVVKTQTKWRRTNDPRVYRKMLSTHPKWLRQKKRPS